MDDVLGRVAGPGARPSRPARAACPPSARRARSGRPRPARRRRRAPCASSCACSPPRRGCRRSRRPRARCGCPCGPIENGITYIVRPRMQPSNRPFERGAHLVGFDPVVGRAGVFLALAADEGAVLDPRDVGRVGPGEVGVRALRRIEPAHRAGGDHLGAQPVVLRLRAVGPVDPVGLGQRCDRCDPLDQAGVLDVRRERRADRPRHRERLLRPSRRAIPGDGSCESPSCLLMRPCAAVGFRGNLRFYTRPPRAPAMRKMPREGAACRARIHAHRIAGRQRRACGPGRATPGPFRRQTEN